MNTKPTPEQVEEEAYRLFQEDVETPVPNDPCTCRVQAVWINKGTPDSHFETRMEYDPICPIHGRTE